MMIMMMMMIMIMTRAGGDAEHHDNTSINKVWSWNMHVQQLANNQHARANKESSSNYCALDKKSIITRVADTRTVSLYSP